MGMVDILSNDWLLSASAGWQGFSGTDFYQFIRNNAHRTRWIQERDAVALHRRYHETFSPLVAFIEHGGSF